MLKSLHYTLELQLMAEILHQLMGSLSHYLQGFSNIPGGCLGFQPSTVAHFLFTPLHLHLDFSRLSRGLLDKNHRDRDGTSCHRSVLLGKNSLKKGLENGFFEVGKCTWNPNDLCFGWKRPCFGGLTSKNRGHWGSRYT